MDCWPGHDTSKEKLRREIVKTLLGVPTSKFLSFAIGLRLDLLFASQGSWFLIAAGLKYSAFRRYISSQPLIYVRGEGTAESEMGLSVTLNDIGSNRHWLRCPRVSTYLLSSLSNSIALNRCRSRYDDNKT